MMNAIMTIALKEFKDGLRNRWVLAITLIFAMLSIGLSYFGAAVSGTVGFTSVSTTIVSLASLAVVIIPLIALILSYDAIVGEDEIGTLLLLLTYPLTRFQLLAGKFLGHGLIMAVSIMIGFGCAAIVILLFSQEIETQPVIYSFSRFLLSAILLGWVFIALAYVVSAAVNEKSKAAGFVLIIWFLSVFVFDLSLLAILVYFQESLNEVWMSYVLLLNPTDVFRLYNLLGFDNQSVTTGVITIANNHLNSVLLLIVLFIWILLPLICAYRIFARRVV